MPEPGSVVRFRNRDRVPRPGDDENVILYNENKLRKSEGCK